MRMGCLMGSVTGPVRKLLHSKMVICDKGDHTGILEVDEWMAVGKVLKITPCQGQDSYLTRKGSYFRI